MNQICHLLQLDGYVVNDVDRQSSGCFGFDAQARDVPPFNQFHHAL